MFGTFLKKAKKAPTQINAPGASFLTELVYIFIFSAALFAIMAA